MNDIEQRVVSQVLSGLGQNNPSREELEQRFRATVAMERLIDNAVDIDDERVLRELEAITTVEMDEPIGMVDSSNHEEWLAAERATIDWAFFEQYREWLVRHERLPPEVVDRVDKSTERVLGMLEDPKRPGAWDRRGMVVGQVQSGKTSNYTALICKAADAGYRVIIVLAGTHNSLRAQTQLRLDEGFLGFDTQQRRSSSDQALVNAIGVMTMAGARRNHAHSLTTSDERGDFVKSRADQNVTLMGSGEPIIAVVKKNTSVLEKLTKWLTDNSKQGPTGKIFDRAILVIDDEADHASINTRRNEPGRAAQAAVDKETDPTAINRAIRLLLGKFSRVAYVGYTATPFANIFIDRDADHSLYGSDLFPGAFIEYLRPPSNYLGPARLFGLKPNHPMPLSRMIDDHSKWMPLKHRSNHRPDPAAFPDSLRSALRAFVLARATRLARGQTNKHNSMLVHVTSFQDVQEIVREQIEKELAALHNDLRYGGPNGDARQLLHGDWLNDFVGTSAQLGNELPSWAAVNDLLIESISQIEPPKAINGSSADVLSYWEGRKHGINIIAVGGNKLSRGLTLEGLTVSYYLRSAGTYDTLLQMGRWFGYRPGYEDLCRLWTTESLLAAYAEVTSANEELVREFEYMCALRKTPAEFGLRVRDSSSSMHITAANKRGKSREIRINFSGGPAETVALPCATETSEENLATTESFLHAAAPYLLGRHDGSLSALKFANVPGQLVVDAFLRKYKTDPSAVRVQSRMILDYVTARIEIGELTEWTVILASNSLAKPDKKEAIAGYEIGLIKRSLLGRADDASGDEDPNGQFIGKDLVWRFRRILSPRDEMLDVSEEKRAELLAKTREHAKSLGKGPNDLPRDPSGPIIRAAREASKGYLVLYPLAPPEQQNIPESLAGSVTSKPMIGFFFSFPESSNPEPVKYRVDSLFWEEYFGGDQ